MYIGKIKKMISETKGTRLSASKKVGERVRNNADRRKKTKYEQYVYVIRPFVLEVSWQEP